MYIISDKEINEEFAPFEYHIHRLWQLHGDFKPQFVLLQYTNLFNQLDAFLAIYIAEWGHILTRKLPSEDGV